MPRHQKYEEMIDLLINEKSEEAEKLLHDLIVEKARSIYEELVNDEELEDEEDLLAQEADLSETIGGDPKEDFVDSIKTDEEDIEADELFDGDVEDAELEMEDDLESEDVEDKVDDLQDQLDMLRAEFEKLRDEELEEPQHDVEDFEVDDFDVEMAHDEDEDLEDDEFKMESLEEATKMQDEVHITLDDQDAFVGTGKGSKKGKVNTKSPVAPNAKSINDAEPVDFGKGGVEKGGSPEKSKNCTPSDNIGDPDKMSHSAPEEGKGDRFVGTGKGSKLGKPNNKSPMQPAK